MQYGIKDFSRSMQGTSCIQIFIVNKNLRQQTTEAFYTSLQR